MLVKHSYDERFVTLMGNLHKKYGEEMFVLSGIGEKDLDINSYSKNFFGLSKSNIADKSVDSNANVSDKSVLSWETESGKPLKRLNSMYMLWKEALNKHGIKRANKMIEAEINGTIRIHDLHMFNKSYCYASSLMPIVQDGMPFWDDDIRGVKHFDSLLRLAEQYICYMSNQIAGAVALPDLFVYADYFVRKDFGDTWYEDKNVLSRIEQLFQQFIYSINFCWRSNQSPFTNISVFDKYWLEALFGSHINPDFSKPNFENVDRIQRLFVSILVKNSSTKPKTYPVMTAALLRDKDTGIPKDEVFFDWMAEITAETALFNILTDSATSSLSSCCRLRSNIEEANKQISNSFGVGGVNIGSHRVVTLNLPQISYIAESWDDFKKILEARIELSQDILDIHRALIQDLIDNGFLPLYKYNCMHLDKQFSTLGFIGLYECLEIMGYDIITDDGSAKAKEILDLFNSMNNKRSKIDGKIRNVEQIPGESAASNLAKKDAVLFPERELKYDIYSNQYIPLTKNVDLVDRITIQGRFDKECGGGAIGHWNITDKLTKEQVKKIIIFAGSKGVIYFAFNYNFTQCTTCKQIYIGKFDKSPCHQAEVRRYLRIVGFLTEISSWSKPRLNELPHRQFYDDVDIKV